MEELRTGLSTRIESRKNTLRPSTLTTDSKPVRAINEDEFQLFQALLRDEAEKDTSMMDTAMVKLIQREEKQEQIERQKEYEDHLLKQREQEQARKQKELMKQKQRMEEQEKLISIVSKVLKKHGIPLQRTDVVSCLNVYGVRLQNLNTEILNQIVLELRMKYSTATTTTSTTSTTTAHKDKYEERPSTTHHTSLTDTEIHTVTICSVNKSERETSTDFTVYFDTAYSNGENTPSCSLPLKMQQVQSVKLVSVSLPTEYLSAEEPFLLLEIPELGGTTMSTHPQLQASFAQLNFPQSNAVYTHWNSNTVSKEFNPVISLDKLSLKLKKLSGDIVAPPSSTEDKDLEPVIVYTFEISCRRRNLENNFVQPRG